jgi:hypothetical protein
MSGAGKHPTAGELMRLTQAAATNERIGVALRKDMSGEAWAACAAIIDAAKASVARKVQSYLQAAIAKGTQPYISLNQLITPIWEANEPKLTGYIKFDDFRTAIREGENSEFAGGVSIDEYIAAEMGRSTQTPTAPQASPVAARATKQRRHGLSRAQRHTAASTHLE